jgi:hypothetical protein
MAVACDGSRRSIADAFVARPFAVQPPALDGARRSHVLAALARSGKPVSAFAAEQGLGLSACIFGDGRPLAVQLGRCGLALDPHWCERSYPTSCPKMRSCSNGAPEAPIRCPQGMRRTATASAGDARVITTTSTFAPRIEDDPYIKPFLPYRIELKDSP